VLWDDRVWPDREFGNDRVPIARRAATGRVLPFLRPQHLHFIADTRNTSGLWLRVASTILSHVVSVSIALSTGPMSYKRAFADSMGSRAAARSAADYAAIAIKQGVGEAIDVSVKRPRAARWVHRCIVAEAGRFEK